MDGIVDQLIAAHEHIRFHNGVRPINTTNTIVMNHNRCHVTMLDYQSTCVNEC